MNIHGKYSLFCGSRLSLRRVGRNDFATEETLSEAWILEWWSTEMPLCCCWCCLKDEEEATEEEEAATELLVECQNGSLQRPQILPSDTAFSLPSAIVIVVEGTFWVFW